MDICHLDAQIKAVYPACVGVSVGTQTDKSTWKVYPIPTGADKIATDAVIAAFDFAAPCTDAQKIADAGSLYDISKDLKALALVVMEEINLIRGSSAATIAAMTDRTEDQLRTAFINKRKTL